MTITWKYLTGRNRTATDKTGTLLHATDAPDYGGPSFETSICGRKPGKRSNGWDTLPEYARDTLSYCPKCLKRLKALENNVQA